MPRKALYRMSDGLLLAHGFVNFTPGAGEAVEDVPGDFPHAPGLAKRTGPGIWAQYTPPAPSADELEADCLAYLNGGVGGIDLRKVIKAHVISCEAYRLGVNPGSLTAQQLQNIRARVAAIYKAL